MSRRTDLLQSLLQSDKFGDEKSQEQKFLAATAELILTDLIGIAIKGVEAQGAGSLVINLMNDSTTFMSGSSIEADIHIIGIDSDMFFVSEENTATLKLLHPNLSNVYYHEITSIHGHDAFLIEYEQLNSIIDKIFKLELV